MLELAAIRTDGGTQTRAAVNPETVSDYAEAMEAGDQFPPLTVFHDGAAYWLADGFHRYHAALKLQAPQVEADVKQGARRDAVLYSVGANATHGLRRTNEDKRRAVMVLLEDEEWCEWSDREIARRAGVSAPTVGALRKEVTVKLLQSSPTVEPAHPTTRKGADGRTINTANIGKPKADTPAPAADLSEYTQPRHLKTYSPPPLPDPEPDEPEEDELLDALVTDEPEDEPDLEPYRPPYPMPTSPDIRVKPDDPSRRRPFMRAFTAAGALSNLSDDVIVAGLLSPENQAPQRDALDLELRVVVEKISRCMALAEQERKTVTI